MALIEPVKGYQRGKEQPGTTQHRPLTGLADCATPDSAPSREFARAVEAVIGDAAAPESLEPHFESWKQLGQALADRASEFGPRSAELQALAKQLRTTADIALGLLPEPASRADPAINAAIARLQATVTPAQASSRLLPRTGKPRFALARGLARTSGNARVSGTGTMKHEPAAPQTAHPQTGYNRFLLLVAGLGGLLYRIDVGIIAGASVLGTPAARVRLATNADGSSSRSTRSTQAGTFTCRNPTWTRVRRKTSGISRG